MSSNRAKTFPGVYTQLTDASYFTPRQSRYKPGLIGTASKGPMNTPVTVRSAGEFVRVFGQPVAQTGVGCYLADAISLVEDFSDNMTVVRVGNQLVELGNGGLMTIDTSIFNYTFSSTAYIYTLYHSGATPIKLKLEYSTGRNVYDLVVTSATPSTYVINDSATTGDAVADGSGTAWYQVGRWSASEGETFIETIGGSVNTAIAAMTAAGYKVYLTLVSDSGWKMEYIPVAGYQDGTGGIILDRPLVGDGPVTVYAFAGNFGVTSYTGLLTNETDANTLKRLTTQGEDVYLRLDYSTGELVTDARIIAVTGESDNNGTATVTVEGTGIVDGACVVSYSIGADPAVYADGVLKGVVYSGSEVVFTSLTGDTSDPFVLTGALSSGTLAFGDLVKVSENVNPSHSQAAQDAEAAKNVTYEIRVDHYDGTTVHFTESDNAEIGYQAVPLQDYYGSAKVVKAVSVSDAFRIRAVTMGDWANGTSSATGVALQVRPGSKPSTKKLEVYWNAKLVETFDNLSCNKLVNGVANADYYTTRINNISQFIYITNDPQDGVHAANTVKPWKLEYNDPVYDTDPNIGWLSMPFGAVNACDIAVSAYKTYYTGGQLSGGSNGLNPSAADYVGTYDQVTGESTGLKCFADRTLTTVNVIAAPMNNIPFSVQAELARVARKRNILALNDVPKGLTLRQAIDWHNGAGAYANWVAGTSTSPTSQRIDNANIALFYNWGTLSSVYDGTTHQVPPSLGALRCLGFTFDRVKPWRAPAGPVNGYIPEFTGLEFNWLSDDDKQAAYGNGNAINVILKDNGRIQLYGNRTMQRTESKLTAISNLIVSNWLLDGLENIGKRFVFEPNDSELLDQINLAFTDYLDKLVNDRALEKYLLQVDDKNNTPETRNNREVIVDLQFVPTDPAERIYINATVRESGAELNNIG